MAKSREESVKEEQGEVEPALGLGALVLTKTKTNIEDRWTDVGGRCDCESVTDNSQLGGGRASGPGLASGPPTVVTTVAVWRGVLHKFRASFLAGDEK